MPGRLLIVEDEDPIRNLMREYFLARGYAVDCAAGLEEAQGLLRSHTYTVLLSDVSLGSGYQGREGLQLLEAARALPVRPGVILLTALELSARDFPSSCAPDLLLHKPLRLSAVAAHVERLTSSSLPTASCA